MEESMKTKIQLKAIGYTSNRQGFSLHLDEAHRSALKGLEGFQYVQVLFWADGLDNPEYRKETVLAKPYKIGPQELGIFVTRSPLRPNPILLSAAQVLDLDVEAGVVKLAYLDAEEGSPILDIKPYLPATERIRDAAVPQWCAHWPEFYEDSAAFDWAGEFENAQ
jgi:tRNA-Thr(GGU) m(6)t(6)A37 methyltransferase TsaA